MQIDWFTLIAQIVNFLILVWLLKHFLYDRIVDSMDKRREKISSRLKEADDKKTEAEKLREEYENKKKELEGKREEIISDAKEEAEKRKKQMLHESREEIEQLRQDWQKSLEHEKSSILNTLRDRTARQVFEISRQVLDDLAGAELQEQMIDRFLERFSELSQKQLDKLKSSVSGNKGQVQVLSSFEISGKTKEKLTRALKDKLDGIRDIDYEEDSDLRCGIALVAEGQRIEWNIDDYLEGLEEEFKERMVELKAEKVKGQDKPDGEDDNKKPEEQEPEKPSQSDK
ncbi:MAG TPA: ATP synthase F0 subunit B [candidate division Zixibacteria bacterium]|nr:ATP synthase F0 subunit B [candidate division Zixibacteria bacterium]HEQ97734.1 ATP synthase F0 subunit B [candidate division Zixibacteria bacterium]